MTEVAPVASPAETGKITAIVVNYNAGEALLTCVKSLAGEGVGRIVVVDNKSVDGSLASLRTAWPAAIAIEAPSNLGYGGGANLGSRETETPYLLVCNPDLEVEPGAVATLLGALQAQPEVGLVGPLLRQSNGHVYPSGRDFPGLGESLGHGFLGMFWGGNPWTRRYRRIGAEQHRSRPADWVSGAFFLVKRDAFESVGGFDESYFMYVEDVDLCWRLRQAGWEIWYEAAAEVVHEQGRSTARHPYAMLVAHHRSMWRFARTTAMGRQRYLLPVVAAGLGVRLLLTWAEHLVGLRSRLASRHG